MTHRPISLDELDRLGLDERGQLYWDGKEVVTTMSLPRWVQASALVAAAGTMISALAAVAALFLGK